MRTVVRVSMALVALAAAALSYQSLARLGELCGYGGLSWLYPLVVDAGAAASCATWLHARSRQALGMTWALLAASVVLNGTVHYLDSTGTAPSWLLVVAVAAVPPLVLGLCVHLAVGMGRPGVRSTDTRSDDLGTTEVVADLTGTEHGSGPAEALRDSQTLPDRTDDELLAAIKDMSDRDGKRPSRNKVTSELGVGATRATRLLEKFDHTGPRRRTA